MVLRDRFNTNKRALGIFVLAFVYLLYLTAGVNPMWESHLFIEGNSRTPFSISLVNTFKPLSDDITGSHGPFNSVYYHALFSLFGYNFFYYRVVKSLFFAGVVFFFFLVCSEFMQRRYAVGGALFVLFSFPIFIQTFVFDEGFIIGEFFKMVAIFLFVRIVHRREISIILKIGVLLFGLLAIRTYTATFAIVPLFSVYLLVFHRQKIAAYAPVLAYLLITKIPFNRAALQFSDAHYGFKGAVALKFLVNNAQHYILSPMPDFSDLYYKPLVSIFTFFGFWLVIFLVTSIFLRSFLNKKFPRMFAIKKFSRDKKCAVWFFIMWAVCEMPIFFVLPEHAIRYAAGIMTPLAGIVCVLFENVMTGTQKKSIKSVLVLLVIITIMTNAAYAILFRATWGSSFIGMDNVSTFILESDLLKDQKAIVYYYATSVAPEYYTVDKTQTDRYTVSDRIIPEVIDLNEFSSAYLEKQRSKKMQMYVVKRITSFRHSEYPPLNLDTFKNLEKIKVIEGKDEGLFDKTAAVVTQLLRLPYKPNMFYVYKVVNKKSDRR